MKKVLVIDDEEKLRGLLTRLIAFEGYEVIQAPDCKSGLKKLEQHEIDIVLCDVKLPDGNGVDLTLTIKEKYPLVEVILLTAYGNIPDGVQAIKNGAFDYITKGDDNNRILPLLNRAAEKTDLSRRIQRLETRLQDKHSFDRIIGSSRPHLAALDLARKVAPTDTTVLLTGETGTGKEVFAQALHQASTRHARNFLAINCSAFSAELLESELFGHKAGAFTGALKDKKGLFEEAHKGTLFLDEIGEMALPLQAKLLRVLESGEFLRVGDTKPTQVDIRLIAATNRDLPKEITAGHFRQDLFFRLSVFQIQLPPLRERTSDLPALAQHFLQHFAHKTNKKVTTISPAFLQALSHHTWPGNIRELKNIIERSVILSSGPQLTPDTLPFELQTLYPTTDKPHSPFELATAEKAHIQKVMRHTGGNKTEAARLLNIALTTLYRKLEEYHI